MAKIAINGFGRIGRLFFRQAFGHPQIDIRAINDLGTLKNLAYLLKYDTVYGEYEKEVSFDEEKGVLIVDGKEIRFLQERDPLKLPWKEMDIDVVVEATGVFAAFSKAAVHFKAGAKKVVITAPAKDQEGVEGGKTILVGVNEKDFTDAKLTSNGSCTTNAIAQVIKILDENIGIAKAVLNTIHAYTANQNLVDGVSRSSDLRRGRAAAHNIVPTSTGAAICTTRMIKNLEGKFDGIALRVPVICGSIADITAVVKRDTTVEEINQILKRESENPRWRGLLKVNEQPLVSSDIIKQPYGAIVDLSFTKVIDKNLVKVLVWYDNEWGYVTTLIKHILELVES